MVVVATHQSPLLSPQLHHLLLSLALPLATHQGTSSPGQLSVCTAHVYGWDHSSANTCKRVPTHCSGSGNQHGLSNKRALNNPGPTLAFTIEISHDAPTRAVNQATGDNVCNGDFICPLLCTRDTPFLWILPLQTLYRHRDSLLLRQRCFAACFRYQLLL